MPKPRKPICRQADPLSDILRVNHYQRQNPRTGRRTTLTPKQRRRFEHKQRNASARRQQALRDALKG